MNVGVIIVSSISLSLLLLLVVLSVLYYTGKLDNIISGPVDCEVSGWGPCDKKTGFRTRTVTIPKVGSGAECPELKKECDIDCVTTEWGSCVDGKQTRRITTEPKNNGKTCGELTKKCLEPPKLIDGKLQFQYDCTDCSGLVWTSVSDKPWNRYYKASCTDGAIESEMVGPFGPIGNNMFNNPKIRLGPNGPNNGCGTNNINIYRSKTVDGNYIKIPPENLRSFRGDAQWDGRDAIFIDNDNSPEY